MEHPKTWLKKTWSLSKQSKAMQHMEQYEAKKKADDVLDAMFYVQEALTYTKKMKNPGKLEKELVLMRANIQFRIRNWANALEDFMTLMKENPTEETVLKSFECFLALKNTDKAARMIGILESLKSPKAEEAQKRLKMTENEIAQEIQKMNLLKNYKEEEKTFIHQELTKRKIKLLPQIHNIPGYIESPIYLDEAETLHLPVLIVYEEHNITDFMQDVSEHASIEDILGMLLKEPLPWDKNKDYKLEALVPYLEVNMYDDKAKMDASYFYPLRRDDTLIYALTRKKVWMSGLPVIYIESLKSKHFKAFQEQKLICKR